MSNRIEVVALALSFCAIVELGSAFIRSNVHPANERSLVCPGDTIGFNCTVEGTAAATLRWFIWCNCSSTACSEVNRETTVSSDVEENKRLCRSEYSFRTGTITTNIFSLDVVVFHNATGEIRIQCESSSSRYIQVAGLDLSSFTWNFTYIPEFTNDTDVVVSFMWSPVLDARNTNRMDIEYSITITGFNTTITANTITSSFTATLQFNVTYLISLHASRCNHTLISDPFTTNVTINNVCPFPPISGVVVSTILEGRVISYQCEEGLVPEGRVKAVCGADGLWSPDPTNHMCSSDVTSQSFVTVLTDPKEQNSTTVSVYIYALIGVSGITLVFSVGAFLLGVITGMIAGTCRTKRKLSEITVTNTQSELVPASNQNDARPGGIPEYEEIVLHEIKEIDLTSNAAYGCTSYN